MSSGKAREIISSLIEALGMERFLSEMNVSREDVDAWLKGERPIPFHILSKALKMKAKLYSKPKQIKVESYVKPRDKSSATAFKRMLLKSTIIVLAMLILSTVLAPFVEEVYFRGFSYQAFKKSWGTKTAILLCSVFFSMLHMDPWSIPHTFIVGVILTLVYEKTGNLNAAVIAHSMNNLLAVLIYLFT